MGPTGAGKSTVAARLAVHLGVKPTSIDDIHWGPAWVEGPRGQTAKQVQAVAAQPCWVLDGNYSFIRSQVADRVQLFVWLDLPLRVTFPRLALRGVFRSLRKTPCCSGNVETLRRTFLQRDSLLLWALTHFDETRRKAAQTAVAHRHVRLRSQREVDRWLKHALASRRRRM